jgi:hypothetical protein
VSTTVVYPAVKSNQIVLFSERYALLKVNGLNGNFHSGKTMAKWNQEMKAIESLSLIFSAHAVKLLKLSSRRIAILDGGKNLSYFFL